MLKFKSTFGFAWIVTVVLLLALPPLAETAGTASPAGDTRENLSLASTIAAAVKVNLDLAASQEELQAAEYTQRARKTAFWPTFGASYQYRHHYEERSDPFFGITQPQNQYSFVASVTQPLFAGFALLNQYQIAELGVDLAAIKRQLAHQDLVRETNEIYFSVLKAQKIYAVSKETVTQIDAQREVAQNFYQVGMKPLNDLLQAQVELANANQNLLAAQNNLEAAKARFNTLLRRPLDTPVQIEDVLDFTPLDMDLDSCQIEALQRRLELKLAELEIQIAAKEVQLAQKNYYPSVQLQANLYQQGTDWDANGGDGISDPHSWDVRALASWDFWEWNRPSLEAKAKLSRQAQARHRKAQLEDGIRLEVKQAYLKSKEAEKNIATSQKAIEQARENFRINEERYKEQVATSTDVLDAQTLLSRTMTNYYNALYDFKIARAYLYRAIGQEVDK